MRNLIVSEFVSLDGVIESPESWTYPFWHPSIGQFKRDELFTTDTLLLGRVTYEGYADAWPDRKDDEGYADRMNQIEKFVVSRTLHQATWENTQIINEQAVEQIRELKERPGLDILVFGSGELIKTLRDHDLVDHYNLLIYPTIIGRGKRLFHDAAPSNLVLSESKMYSSGVIGVTYQVVHA